MLILLAVGSELWMLTGNAVRMTMDLGAHLDNHGGSGSSSHDSTYRLMFWSVFCLDFAVALGVGNRMTLRLDAVSQPLPSAKDFSDQPGSGSGQGAGAGAGETFIQLARFMTCFAVLVDALNSADADGRRDGIIQGCRKKAMREYGALPPHLKWNTQKYVRRSSQCFNALLLSNPLSISVSVSIQSRAHR
jgi:hypothetical protein